MPPAERPQLERIQALRAEREPRDPGVGERGRIAALVGPRVRLDRDLRVRGDPEPSSDEVEQLGDDVRTQESSASRRPGRSCRAAAAPPIPGRRTGPPARRPAARAPSAARPGRLQCGSSDRAWPRPATTTKSQYGQIETQNGMWTYSPTGGRTVRGPAAASGPAASVVGAAARASGPSVAMASGAVEVGGFTGPAKQAPAVRSRASPAAAGASPRSPRPPGRVAGTGRRGPSRGTPRSASRRAPGTPQRSRP